MSNNLDVIALQAAREIEHISTDLPTVQRKARIQCAVLKALQRIVEPASPESLADELERLCCAETESQFFNRVTDNVPTILAALRHTPTYGIIDPDYARVFTISRVLAWSEGYALAIHGSFTRDLDLIAIPWTETPCEPAHLLRRIEAATGLKNISKEPGKKPQGRLAWTLTFPTFGDPRFVDFSILRPAGVSPI